MFFQLLMHLAKSEHERQVEKKGRYIAKKG
jgi:hypothetical protein